MSCRVHVASFLNAMKRDIDILKDVYAHFVLSGGTTVLLKMKIKVLTPPDDIIPIVGTKRFRCAEVLLLPSFQLAESTSSRSRATWNAT